jgi:hypothetical protein
VLRCNIQNFFLEEKMKHLLILVMIISLLTAAVLGCSSGLVSQNENDFSGEEIPTQETTFGK